MEAAEPFVMLQSTCQCLYTCILEATHVRLLHVEAKLGRTWSNMDHKMENLVTCGVELVPDTAAEWRGQANSSSAQGRNPRDLDSESALWQGLLAGETLNPTCPPATLWVWLSLSVSHAALLMVCLNQPCHCPALSLFQMSFRALHRHVSSDFPN